MSADIFMHLFVLLRDTPVDSDLPGCPREWFNSQWPSNCESVECRHLPRSKKSSRKRQASEPRPFPSMSVINNQIKAPSPCTRFSSSYFTSFLERRVRLRRRPAVTIPALRSPIIPGSGTGAVREP